MKKILVLGSCPLPEDNTKSRPAAGLRTHQFMRALRGSGHEIKLVAIAMPECYGENEEIKSEGGRVSISKNDPGLIQKIQKIHDEYEPDIILSVNSYPSYIAASLKSEAVLWADLNGWLMAEAQAQAYKSGTNDYLAHYYHMEDLILRRADKFSTVSRAQGSALLGELARIGRLNCESFGYEFVVPVANGTEWFDGEEGGENSGGAVDNYGGAWDAVGDEKGRIDHAPEALADLPEDAFVLLWMGGYNTWVDEETLFKGVEAAMRKSDDLYFVSTGGGISGLDNSTFSNFIEMVDRSEYKKRFVFLGWVETAQIPSIYKRADAGLNVDRNCVETLTGARNRINEMMKFGLPVITTLGSEISYEVERVGAGVCVVSGDWVALGDAIFSMCEGELRAYGENGARYIKEECNYAVLGRPLIKWLEEGAAAAPDRGVSVNFGGAGKLRAGFRYLKENGLVKFLKKLWQRK
jgi:glycosyltransferase involved in cell wall biosynthesis